MIRALFVCLLVACAVFPAAADVETGMEAFRRGDYAAARTAWEPLAKSGDAAAQFNLGTLYETGNGVNRDDATAAKWYREAAEQEVSVAQINLGSLYAQGRGVARDDRAALRWYLRAAQSGVPEAHYNPGVLYENSSDLGDDREAYFWYAVAGKGGHRKSVLLREKIGEADAAEIERRAASWRPGKTRGPVEAGKK